MHSYASVFYRKPIVCVCICSNIIYREVWVPTTSIGPCIIVLLHIQHRRCSCGTNILTYSSRNSKLSMCFVIFHCHHQPLTLLPPTRTFLLCIIVCVIRTCIHLLRMKYSVLNVWSSIGWECLIWALLTL